MRALLALALLASTASAEIWRDAITPPDASKDVFEREMREGDEHVLMANSEQMSRPERKRQVNLALTSYRAAAAANPKSAEPYFRIATTLHSFWIESCEDLPQYGISRSPFRDCSNRDVIDTNVAKQIIDAWNEAEKRAPLDPRFSGNDGDSVLFERAILNTKLGTPQSLDAATKDYQAYLDRGDGRGLNVETTRSNLAETYMMLGRLDDSIEAYREIGTPTNTSTLFGAAVALDRAERGELALDLIRGIGRNGFDSFRIKVDRNDVFFVPEGEKFYYFALGEEALGNNEQAIYYWRMFLSSEAGRRKTAPHPQFAARAKHHLDALIKKRGKTPPPPDPFLDIR